MKKLYYFDHLIAVFVKKNISSNHSRIAETVTTEISSCCWIIIFLSNLLLCGGGGIFSVKWHGFDGLIAAYNRN